MTLSDYFKSKESMDTNRQEWWNKRKEDLTIGIDQVMTEGTVDKEILALMKELLNRTSIVEYYDDKLEE